MGQINGLNLYMYCGDNPVSNYDPDGSFFLTTLIAGVLIGTVIGAVAGGIYTAVNGQNFWSGALAGLAVGALIGLGIGLGIGLIGVGITASVVGTVAGLGGAILGGLSMASIVIGSIAVGASVYAIISNMAKAIYSREMMGKYGNLDYSDIAIGLSIKTELLTDDETIMKYVNYLYDTQDEIKDNWTKEQLYRELKYHSIGNSSSIFRALFDAHLSEADVEQIQVFRSYFLRFVGNMLW